MVDGKGKRPKNDEEEDFEEKDYFEEYDDLEEEDDTEDDDDSDYIHPGDNDFPQHMRQLLQLQKEIRKLNEEESQKTLEIEQKYRERRKPVYDRRNEVIKSIPDFWFNAFLNHPELSKMFTEEDQKILKYLDSLEVEDFKDMKLGYTITFNFKPNPFFRNRKLTKTLAFFDDEPTKITGTIIRWNHDTGGPYGFPCRKKAIKRPRAEESFFKWLSESPKVVTDYTDEVAEMIKELWPNPLKYFHDDDDDKESDGDENDEEGSDDDHGSDNNDQR